MGLITLEYHKELEVLRQAATVCKNKYLITELDQKAPPFLAYLPVVQKAMHASAP
jgi:hypothetical protein